MLNVLLNDRAVAFQVYNTKTNVSFINYLAIHIKRIYLKVNLEPFPGNQKQHHLATTNMTLNLEGYVPKTIQMKLHIRAKNFNELPHCGK